MVEGVLFLLIVINFSLTLTIYIQYNKTKPWNVKKDMTNIVNNFNKNAERNIQILEDRINKTKILLEQYKQQEKRRVINNNQGSINSSKEKLDNIIHTSTKQMEEYTKSLKAKRSAKIRKNTKAKTYIQKAYGSPKEQPIKPLKQKDEFKPFVDNNTINSDLFNNQVKDDIQNTFDENNLFSSKKDTTHKIAKLIGEGRSLKEISDILGISLGEIKLFTSLFRKKILKTD